ANATPHSTEPTHTTKPKPKPKSERPKPKQRGFPRVHLLNHRANLLKVIPSTTSIPLDTSLASPRSKPTLSTFPRPPYLSTKFARLIPAYAFARSSPELYIVTRSVELFGLPGQTDWVSELSERLAPGVVLDRVTDVLSRLEWTRKDVRSLKETAWAEHLVAMQNPRLGRGMDEDFDAPAWPPPTSAPTPGDPPSLSWSTSGERDEPLPVHTRFSGVPTHAYGKHTFPRPKRIVRVRSYDKSLVLVLASPAARRAVLAAYAHWIRRGLGTAFKERDNKENKLGKGRGVWPPVNEREVGGVHRRDQDYETLFGALERWGDEWHPRGRWSVGHGGVGGRATGIGVGGFILGGGYSWLSNQYGLAIDSVAAFEIVLPNGTITTTTESTNPDLFFGLKGGFNNFGIVTKFTLLAYPQNQVWGGVRTFSQDQLAEVNAATVDFIAKVSDPKAAIIPSPCTTILNRLQTGISLLMFYDGPNPPVGIFERYTSIPSASSDVSTRTMSSLVRANPANGTYGTRTTFNTISLTNYSIPLLNRIQNQSMYWGGKAALHGGLLVSYSVEPFLRTLNMRSKGGAYPHDDFLVPLNLDWSWIGELNDAFFINSAKQSAQVILDQAIAEGRDVGGVKQIKYANYAAADEDLRSIYGPNLDRLKSIKK
ncbi:hypothetical protein FRC06_008547, partial [Ceratobasidium sp. 370]